ncbi:MAG: hypothetical protein U0175_14375 [Caldilineaceae bacterium]
MILNTISTGSTLSQSEVSSVQGKPLLRKSWEFNKGLMVSTLFSLVLIPFVLLAMWLDPVTITGVNGWIKPLKFLISTAIYTSTLFWMLTYVQGWRRYVQLTAWFVGLALIVENSLIIVQVLRGTTSHFNVSTVFDGIVFSTMGMLIFTLAFLNLLVAIRLVFQKMEDRVFAWSLRLGLLTTVAGMLVAMLMTTPTAAQMDRVRKTGEMPVVGAHSVGVADGGPGLPLVGWSTEGGDLRIPHFIGLHAMQIIPLVGWLLTRRRSQQRWGEGQRLALVWTAGLGYVGLFGLLTWQALRGQSIIAPDGLTGVAFAGLLALLAISTILVLNRKPTEA